MGSVPSFIREQANALRGFDPGAVWMGMSPNVRAMLVMQATTRPPLEAEFLRWEHMTRAERDLIGTVIRAYGKACSGDALRLGLPVSAGA